MTTFLLSIFHLWLYSIISIVEQLYLWYNWESFGYMSKIGMTGFWCTLISNFLGNCNISGQSGCTSSHSHQQWRNVPFTQNLFQHVISLLFLTHVTCYLRVVLIRISLMDKNAEQFFKWISVIRDSSLENFLCKSVTHFWLDYLVF